MKSKIISLFLSLILNTILFLGFAPAARATQPVPDFRLNLVINQPSDLTLTLSTVGLEEGPYVSYGINYPNQYYLIKIVDTNSAELFLGKTPSVYQTSAPDFVPVSNFTPETIIADPIRLYLPYFNEATKIQFFDENAALKLEVILADHQLQGLKYRFAACDLCGYCQGQDPPASWEKCRICLYPAANPTPTIGDTLRITDPTSNAGPTPYPGKTYTGIGCIKTGQSTFTQTILNLVFSLTGGIALLYLLYGAFMVATSQADAEKLQRGRRIIQRAIVGVVLTLSSLLISNVLASGILRIPGFSSP